MRRLARASASCSGSGQNVTSSTLSSMRVDTRTTSAKASKSNVDSAVNGWRTKPVRLIDPRQQQPYDGSGCSAHGLVASMVSQ
ncbi:hypothetical protein D3C85_1378110 [compost metagenome]